ncbi:MAG: preprotein translocase subunit SecY [Pseudomonadota bacterium]
MVQASLKKESGLGELKSRLLFLLFAFMVYRIGTHIPLPGINPDQVKALFNQNEGTILGLFNMFSGGALERMSILALGIMPYISASIIMQLMTAVLPSLEALKKEGQAGQRKITQYTRYGTLGLAILQSTGMVFGMASQGLFFSTELIVTGTATVSLVCGAMFMMWLGEQITERGIGNGISMLIFAGIVAGLPSAVFQTIEQAKNGQLSIFVVLAVLALALLLVWAIIYIERGQRRIVINSARRQRGRQVMQGQRSHLPLRVNMAGVIPPIFASSLLLFPASIAQWVGQSEGMEWLQNVAFALGPGQPLNIIVFGALIIFFCFFYTALVFNPREVAENLKRSNAFLQGIRPGEQTSKYIDGVLTKLTLFGAMYMAVICLIPQFLIMSANVPFYLGGTSLLIVVVVVMDFMAQVQSHLMSHQYDGLLQKANLNNG